MSVNLFSNNNFRLHWASSTISHVGSFFTMIALPWLVLYLTNNDPFIMATVMACLSLPQGAFILFGGALADRLSPLRVLLVSRSVFCVAMLSLAVMVYLQLVPLWSLYLYAIFFGVLVGFCTPAAQALLPSFLPGEQLGKANGVVMGSMQVAQMVGPLLAGWVIWLGREISGASEGSVDYTGLAFAFTVDAFTMFIALVLMSFMRINAKKNSTSDNLMALFKQGVQFCWSDQGIRVVLVYLILISFFLHGPLMASIPIFTKINLGLDEKAYGSLYAMMGIGTLMGAGVAILKNFSKRQLGIVVLGCDLIAGLGLFCIGFQTSIWLAGALLLIIGLCGGIIMVAGTTWFQTRTPGEFMGRVMAILMFSIVGLIPISSTISGYFIKAFSANSVMHVAGLMMFSCAAIGLVIPYVRNMGMLPTSTMSNETLAFTEHAEC